MKEIMREDSKYKVRAKEEKVSLRESEADRLVEKWSSKEGIGEGLQDAPVNVARGAAFILENQEDHLGRLTETQISTAFSTTPENVMKIVRLGYPNSVRGEIFMEWAMQTARDSIYYLYPQYDTTKRGATAGGRTIESAAYRFSSEVAQDTNSSAGDGSTVTFTGTASVTPVVPYSVRVYVDGVLVGNDNGRGTFPPTSGGDNVTGIASGTPVTIFTAQ